MKLTTKFDLGDVVVEEVDGHFYEQGIVREIKIVNFSTNLVDMPVIGYRMDGCKNYITEGRLRLRVLEDDNVVDEMSE